MSAFNHEEFEAAKAAAAASRSQRKQHDVNDYNTMLMSTSSSSSASSPSAPTSSSMPQIRQEDIEDHPRVREEMPKKTKVDLIAFLQGAAGPADQRYLKQQIHAAKIAMDPNVEVYNENERRSRKYSSTYRSDNEDSARKPEASSFYILLRVLLLSILCSAAILYCSLSFLPSMQQGSILWFLQVFCVIFAALYYASFFS